MTTVNYTVENIRPDTSEKSLKELKDILKASENKHVTNMHIDGNGSKYLYIYTHEPTLVVRISDHPTGAENAINVATKPKLFAEVLKLFGKIKKTNHEKTNP